MQRRTFRHEKSRFFAPPSFEGRLSCPKLNLSDSINPKNNLLFAIGYLLTAGNWRLVTGDFQLPILQEVLMNRHSFTYQQYCPVVDKIVIIEELTFLSGRKKIRCLYYHKCNCKEMGGCKNKYVKRRIEAVEKKEE